MATLGTILDATFDEYKSLVDATEPLLTALDERSGDGDFGANLSGGLERAALRGAGESKWSALSRVFLDDVGGTSGPLLGLLFQNLQIAAQRASSVAELLRDGAGAGLDAVQRVGEAQVGDRTLVDSLEPAVVALTEGGDVRAAAVAATRGAIATREIVARRGRASYVGDRAIGHPDPGAVGIALLFVAFARAADVDVDATLTQLLSAASAEASTATSPGAADDAADAGGANVGAGDQLAAADAARVPLARLDLEARAVLLDSLADALDAHSAELVELAVSETHLAEARLSGEVGRTSFQLRLFAALVREGGFLDVRIDHADPDWPAAPRPDLRRSLRPIGPVLVFAASNFPFAFSVLGGDTASALAAGNPVIVKAHPGHPRLSRRTADIAIEALAAAGAPAGTFGLIVGDAAGVDALKDPRVRAASFTGSIAGGRALFAIAQNRPDPIPFYGELGSNNPVFVTPSAESQHAEQIAEGFVGSFTLGAGQFCTKPGTLFVPSGSAITTLLAAHPLPGPAELLNDRILAGYRKRLQQLMAAPQVETLRSDGDPLADVPAPILLRVEGDQVLSEPSLYLDECFGPAALVVEYSSSEQMMRLAEAYDGQLTATIFGTDDDSPDDLVQALSDRAGRLLWCQWPTGVSVTYAQQHGGPYPASTSPQSTSVGTASIARFLRPVALQGFPQRLLPPELAADEVATDEFAHGSGASSGVATR